MSLLPPNTFHGSNIAAALRTAITHQRRFERDHMLYERDSDMVKGWVAMLESLESSDVRVTRIEQT